MVKNIIQKKNMEININMVKNIIQKNNMFFHELKFLRYVGNLLWGVYILW